jgi:transcriptional regulator of acetoin/glycerol metabolism
VDVPGEHVSSDALDDAAVPAIVMVATGTQPASLVLPAAAELGRRIVAGDRTREIEDEKMSRDHAIVSWHRGTWTVTDRDSRNGTFVDGERVTGNVARRGDVIVRLGTTIFVLLADGRGHPMPSDGETVVGPELARAYDQIRAHAAGATLLLQGESGTGKELAARLYHITGPRKQGPFVMVDCAAILADRPDQLSGYIQRAAGGTLFLDEIIDLDPALHADLLATIEYARDIGFVAATHRELRSAVAEKQFSTELHDRLARTSVRLPPLRARKVDIARLIQRELAAVSPTLLAHAKLVEACLLRPWPGNVRELRTAIRHAAAHAIGGKRDVVRHEDLAATAGMPHASAAADTAVERSNTNVNELDKTTVEAALDKAGGVISAAARSLGLHRTQLYRLMDKLGIARDE